MPATIPDPRHADTSTNYTGPTVAEMIAAHSLTTEIITRHNDPCPILGPSELITLHRYIHDPSQRLEILTDKDLLDADGEEPGTRAQRHHASLVGFALANEYFTEEDIAELREWFGEGHADERMRKGGWNALDAPRPMNPSAPQDT